MKRAEYEDYIKSRVYETQMAGWLRICVS